MEVIEGRSFKQEMGTDYTEAFLVNEKLVKEMGWKDSPIGKSIQWGKHGKIIGVLKDFHFRSLIEKLEPTIVMMRGNSPVASMPVINIKINPENSEETIAFLKKKWFELNPLQPFEYNFLETVIGYQFKIARTIRRLAYYIAFLTIFISCLGLFGLASFVAEKKAKEIAIRKIHGASVRRIFFRLAYGFIKTVFASGILAGLIWIGIISVILNKNPDASQGYPWGTFVVSLIITMFIAVITVSYHAVKAAVADPVKALRCE
jgi:putative ABC transport system permease protein